MTLQEIVYQLRWCEFTCEAGKLEMNVAFQELEKIAARPVFMVTNPDLSKETGENQVVGDYKNTLIDITPL